MWNYRNENDENAPIAVAFRKIRGEKGGIVAVFRDEVADGMAAVYEHAGQHGTASTEWVTRNTVPARESEYAALRTELRDLYHPRHLTTVSLNSKSKGYIYPTVSGDFSELWEVVNAARANDRIEVRSRKSLPDPDGDAVFCGNYDGAEVYAINGNFVVTEHENRYGELETL